MPYYKVCIKITILSMYVENYDKNIYVWKGPLVKTIRPLNTYYGQNCCGHWNSKLTKY